MRAVFPFPPPAPPPITASTSNQPSGLKKQFPRLSRGLLSDLTQGNFGSAMQWTVRRVAGPSALIFIVSVLFLDAACAAERHSAIKPVPQSGNWLKRHESYNARVAKGNVDLVFIGDSITQGWGKQGKKVWAKFYGHRNAVNLGIGGDRTQHVIWRLEHGNMNNIAPKVAVVMIGTNNSGSNSPEEVAQGVAVIVKQIREKSPKTKILLLAIFPRGSYKLGKKRLNNERASALFAKLDDGKHVHFLDIGKGFLQSDGELTAGIMPDLVHLSEQGYTIWAESIEIKLSELLGEK